MSEPPIPELLAVAPIFDDEHPPLPEVARALLDECFKRYSRAMLDATRSSLETTDDLFEGNDAVTDAETLAFRSKRGDWIQRFGQTLKNQFDRRLAGTRRKGRRLDTDISAATLRVLTAFDYEKQAAITRATQRLQWASRREMPALDLRVGLLLVESTFREIDNPFAPAYVLDAVGATSRALFPNPRMWRPLMECILVDITPAVSKVYITLNRYLADQHVMPEIKAALRARSELRPADDSELMPLFTRMLNELNAPGIDGQLNVEVPLTFADPNAPTRPAPEPGAAAAPTERATSPAAAANAANDATRTTGAAAADSPTGVTGAAGAPEVAPRPRENAVPTGVSPEVANALYAVFARVAAQAVQSAPAPAVPPAGTAPPDAFAFPPLDSMMALGASSALIAALERWQRFESQLDSAWRESLPAGPDVPTPPLNRIPLIREAVADTIVSPNDRITMDVVALLFDYIFRDPSIPESQRTPFARLQVPIAKAALLDRSFFSNNKHPARRLLDHLAAASVGSTGDDDYRASYEAIATKVVDQVAQDFKIDVDVFETADAELRPFIAAEQTKTATALSGDVAEALAAEEREADRSEVRALLRDKLAGLDLPFDVRSFTETIWGDYLTTVRIEHGPESDVWKTALTTLDDLLWSITAKERNAQKAKLTRMIPSLIRSLRAGCAALKATGERAQAFFEALYTLHISVLRPRDVPKEGESPAGAPEAAALAIGNVHDFVSEMVVGTWLAFNHDGEMVDARLFWISPLRTKYIFTSRSRSRAFAFTPEELSYEIGAGKASLVVEPVPLFDRAVSAALDSLAAKKPPTAAAA